MAGSRMLTKSLTALHAEAGSLEGLQREIRDAVHGQFEEGEAPSLIWLHRRRQEPRA
jgi:hypothetical protein